MIRGRERPLIALAVTVPGAARAFLLGPLKAMGQSCDMVLFSNFADDNAEDLVAKVPKGSLELVHIPFARKPSLLIDLKSWLLLYRQLRIRRPRLIHSLMPKTGFIAMTASWVARVPVRIHTFTGQVWVTRSGWARKALKTMDRILAKSATHLLADSHSQRAFLLSQGIASHIDVLGQGSVGGVDVARFRPDRAAAEAVRSALGIQADAIVFGFLGRLCWDKGVFDLVEAFGSASIRQDAHLILVGPDEDGIGNGIAARWPELRSRVHLIGLSHEPEHWLAAFDVCCLPSYREGFGTTIIEAAACGVPALASRIYGLSDAVVDGKTGLLHSPADASDIARGMEELAANPGLVQRLGQAALHRARTEFSQDKLAEQWIGHYREIGRQRLDMD